MKKERSYIDSVHFSGRIWTLLMLAVFICFPLAVSVYYDAWPPVSNFFKGFGAVALLFYPTAIIEVTAYSPMLGSGGMYLSFVTGNITNLKLPCALAAMDTSKVRATSEEGEVVSTIAIATSSIVTTIIIALFVIPLRSLLPLLTADNSVFAPAFQQVLPALFGALGASYFAKHWKISIVPIIACVLVLIFVPTMQSGILLFVGIVVALLSTHIMYKKGVI